MLRNGWIIGAASAVLVSTLVGSALADPAADRCGASKLKAAGRYGQALFVCNAKALRAGVAVDPGCQTKNAAKLASAFAKAEGVGGCATTGDAAAIASDAASDADDVATALAPGADDAARLCASSKMKGAGKHYRALLGCWSAAAANSAPPGSVCVSGAYAKLLSVFSKAETKGGCATTGDLAAIDGLDSGSVRDDAKALSPVCGDGVSGPTQQCEGSDDASCPGLCSPTCTCTAAPDCGNGVAELPEECDDGNHDDGDGCSQFCVLENASALCDGVATTAGTAINAVLVSSAFNAPIHATAPPLDPSRLFVVERDGRIRILNLRFNTIEPVPFLDISTLVGTDGEGGLLSMAFDPGYDTNRRFYVNYTNTSGNTTISRYQASAGDPNVADPASERILVVIPQPYSNHNGGQLAFGPDGYLYIGMGDGGGGGDPEENAQDDAKILGKMLRMDVNVDTAPYWAVPPTNPHYVDGTNELELIWAKGMRNPWRFSFDRSNGDLVIGDVGQGSLEEIDYQPVSSTGGENYGWDIFEASMCYEPDPAPVCPATTGFTMPILEYPHGAGCAAITGGFVYRGCAMPDLRSNYFYSDSCENFLRTIQISGGAAVNAQDRTADATSAGASFASVVSFGEDARGEIYVVDIGGSVYRIEPE